MEQSKGKIGIKEFVAISMIILSTKLTDDTPAILYEKLYNAGWMAIIINGIVTILPIFLLIRVITNYQGKGLIEVTNQLFGRFLGYIILFALWLGILAATIIDTAIYTDIVSSMYFVKTPTIVIYGVLMLASAYGAKKGLEKIGSVAWTVFPYLQVPFLIALILTIRHGNTSFLFPFFGPGEWTIMKESVMKLSIFADYLYLFILVPFLSTAATIKKGSWISLFFVVINLVLAMTSFVFLFDYNSLMQMNYPFHEVIRTISAGFITNMETFFFPFWLIGTFVRFSVYLYINALLFGHLFKIKNFEYIIPSLATLIIFIGIIPDTPTFTIFYLRETVLNILSPVFFFLPCLMWLIAKLKGDFKHEKANQ
ncbi:GerAB/ArcD/ProY family transporter [Ornithinibacillus bavariensis]|uniref:Germination protein n=1 Tax=Ornithinibacillus bavariensis TaxID=545502 RepID=A0A919X7P1_9BACI|nr:endospore germination permease [Ornithinibacillus bavariensis]GIO25972.1 germination protein [Ornithinibacillus bavariensis]